MTAGKIDRSHLSPVMTIPAGVDFAGALAEGLLTLYHTDDNPLAMSRVTLLLPTRRAVRTMREAFLRIADGAPLILPQMRPFGDVSDEDMIIGSAHDPEGAHGLDLPPAIAPLDRQANLAQLVKAWFEAQNDDPSLPLCLDLAAALGRFLDLVAMEQADLSALPTLVDDERFAGHWQSVMGFLNIVREAWPAMLEARQAVDAGTRRDALIRALADQWRRTPPNGPIIAAGSTGSVPATAALLKTVARLPEGHVILPGLDLGLDEESWQALSESHPQYGLRHLLEDLETPREGVAHWPWGQPDNRARLPFWRAAMRPAETAHQWRQSASAINADVDQALNGLSVLEAPDQQNEALSIALAMREVLETKQRTATLITPDRQLARRVTAELARWDINIDDSAGVPLTETDPARFLMMVAEVAANGFAPIPLLAMLKHPLARANDARAIRQLERFALRGPKPAAGTASLRSLLNNVGIDRTAKAQALLADLDDLMAPLIAADLKPVPEMLQALITSAEALTQETDTPILWTDEAGEALSQTLTRMIEELGALGPLPLSGLPGVLRSCLAGQAIRPRRRAHPRLQILGPLEARLQQADLTILAGLNEGVWPRQAASDPWLSRPMRRAFGLPQPERQTGLSAHDFVQAASGKTVLLTWSKKRDGAPVAPSRFISRLATLLTATGRTLDEITRTELLDWAIALDQDRATDHETGRPMPCPPVEARPQSLSVTQIETLLRNPYDIYARHILQLKKLDDIEQDADAAERGTILHDVMEGFVQKFSDGLPHLPQDARATLDTIARERFGERLAQPGIRAFWWPRYEAMADFVIKTAYEQQSDIHRSYAEFEGGVTFQLEDGSHFTLRGRADRIDLMRDNRYAVIDYKTGQAPTASQVEVGFASQLPLEALMLRQGAFHNHDKSVALEPREVASLSYWQFGPRPEKCKITYVPKDIQLTDLLDEVEQNLHAMLNRYRTVDEPYIARPYPQRMNDYSDYDHLARVPEWSLIGTDDGGGD